MDKKLLIDLQRVPKHVAIIMDGNGRWAKSKGMSRVFGHRNALTAVRESVETAGKIGIQAITLYTFSTENWKRPKLEVDALMSLIINSLKKELPAFQNNGVVVKTIGNIENLPQKAQKALNDVILQTKENTKIILTLALSYGSREE
ncbi:MAG: undecaprenyl diphosphate synthase, partial [Patiriisocius sp.]